MNNTRIRRANQRDTLAVARLYENEDSDRGFLARQLIRLVDEAACICGAINARHCPVHNEQQAGQ